MLNNPVKMEAFHLTAVIGLFTARFISPSLAFFPVLYAFVSRPHAKASKQDRWTMTVMSLVFSGYNIMLFYAVCLILDIPCCLRYMFLCPLVPLRFMLRRNHMACPANELSARSLVIRLMWDPPILITNYLIYKLFGVRFLHDGHNGFVTRVTDRLLISSLPFASDVRHLHDDWNVKAVVNMCAEYKGPVAEYSQYLVTHLRLPTIDGTMPDKNDLDKSLAFIEDRLASFGSGSGTVLVHCKGGRGRAVTVVMNYLIKHEHMTPEQAFNFIYDKRPVLERDILQYDVFKEPEKSIS